VYLFMTWGRLDERDMENCAGKHKMEAGRVAPRGGAGYFKLQNERKERGYDAKGTSIDFIRIATYNKGGRNFVGFEPCG